MSGMRAWTNRMIERLPVLWAEGLTAAEIGEHLGVSRHRVEVMCAALRLPITKRQIKSEKQRKAA